MIWVSHTRHDSTTGDAYTYQCFISGWSTRYFTGINHCDCTCSTLYRCLMIAYFFSLIAEFVQSMPSKSKPEDLVGLLLSHFPLLHPGNEKVKDEYLKIIPKVSLSSTSV